MKRRLLILLLMVPSFVGVSIGRSPPNGELYLTAHVSMDSGWLAPLACRIVIARRR